MRSRTDLHHYQERAARFVIEKGCCALWLDMGLGKTASTLTAVADLLDSVSVGRVLIIAPLRVANSVWHTEAAKWEHTAHLDIAIATGSADRRKAVLDRGAEVTVINRENVVWLVKHYGKRWPFDMVVLDESSGFKSSKAKRWRALKSARPYIRRVVELTGTPSPNGLEDLWAQLYLLDYGERLGKTKTGFLERWFSPDYMGYDWTPKDGAAEQIHAAVSDIALSMDADDYIELPERVDSVVTVAMPGKLASDYAEMEKTFLLELEESEVEAVSAGALANKLLQFANGAIYTDEDGGWQELHRAKLDALAEIVEDNPEPMLVAYNYRTDLARLRERFPQAETLDSPDAEERWNRGEIPMLLAHPASAGHGLNLQEGGALCVWFGLNWSLEYYQQFAKRLHRQGQTRPVRLIHLVTSGTIDERVMAAIEAKAQTQTELIEYVKADTGRRECPGA